MEPTVVPLQQQTGEPFSDRAITEIDYYLFIRAENVTRK